MDHVAEKGFAAHWRYKEGGESTVGGDQIDKWLTQIRDVLDGENEDAIEFIDEFAMDLQSNDIFVFTPHGDMITLPQERPRWILLSRFTQKLEKNASAERLITSLFL